MSKMLWIIAVAAVMTLTSCQNFWERSPMDSRKETNAQRDIRQAYFEIRKGRFFHAKQIVERAAQLKTLADYIVYDGAGAKKKFLDAIVDQTDLHLISKLRKEDLHKPKRL